MRVPILIVLLVLVAAVSVADAGLIKLIVRVIKISVKAIVGATTGGGAAVTTAVLTTADLALNIGNVVSGGCMYEKEICSLTPEIENLEKTMVPLYNQLTKLDQKNNKNYNDVTKALEKQNELARLADMTQSLVLSIIQEIGDPSQLDKLGKEFESNTRRMVYEFKDNMKQYKEALQMKGINSGLADISVLLYYGSKAAYTSLKSAGKISSPTLLKSVKFPKAGLSKILKPRLLTTISTSLTSVKTFFKKPSIVKFASKAAGGGMVLGSLVGLGLTLGVDIPQARKMRDSLRKTRDEMKQSMNQMKTEIAREKATEGHLNQVFQDLRKSYITLVNTINQSLKNKLSTNGGSTPAQLLNYQNKAIAAFKTINKDLEGVKANFAVIKEVRLGVDYNDDVSRIISTISRKGLGSFTKAQIFGIITAEYPNMRTYKGESLSKFVFGSCRGCPEITLPPGESINRPSRPKKSRN